MGWKKAAAEYPESPQWKRKSFENRELEIGLARTGNRVDAESRSKVHRGRNAASLGNKAIKKSN
jgi:hypothetical protein